MARLLLIRHAQSVWNAEGRAQGWADAPLSAEGVAEAEALGLQLGGRGPAVSAVASSDLQRATHTARILAGATGCAPPRIDARLRERELGWWSGLTSTDMAARWPEELEAWRAHRVERAPGGESTGWVVSRVTAALVALAAWMDEMDETDGSERPDRANGSGAGGTLLVVAHGGVISALERAAGHAVPGVPVPEVTVPEGGGRPAGANALTGPARRGHANLTGRWLEVGPVGVAVRGRFDPAEPEPYDAEAVPTA